MLPRMLINFIGVLLIPGMLIAQDLYTERIVKQDNPQLNNTNLPPLMFPNDTKTFKIIQPSNETALKILQHESTKLKDNDKYNASSMLSTFLKSSRLSTMDIKVDDPKNQIENIQSNENRQPETELEEQFMIKNNSQSIESEIIDRTVIDTPQLSHNDIAVITVVVAAVLCLFCYLGIILWRNILEHRYDFRERLIADNDDDVDDDFSYIKNNTKQFEL